MALSLATAVGIGAGLLRGFCFGTDNLLVHQRLYTRPLAQVEHIRLKRCTHYSLLMMVACGFGLNGAISNLLISVQIKT